MKKIFLFSILISFFNFSITKEEYMKKSALDLTNMVKNKEVSSLELVNTAFDIIDEKNDDLNAVVETIKDEAIKRANYIDEKINQNDEKILSQKFIGVPLLMKGMDILKNSNGFVDLEDEKNKINKYYKQYEKNGFIVLGATNFPEAGMRNVTISHLHGIAKNPLDLTRNPGGSSGGSAASVSSGMVSIASASDMGGSIRIPASFNGLIGFKTTGISSKFPITKTVDDTKEFFLIDNRTKKINKENIISENYGDIENLKNKKILYTYNTGMNTPISNDAKLALTKTVNFLKSNGFDVEEIPFDINGRKLLEEYTYNMLSYGKYFKYLLKNNINKEKMDPLNYAIIKFYEKFKKEIYKDKTNINNNDIIESIKNLHNNNTILIMPTTSSIAPKNPETSDIYNGFIDPEIKEKLLKIDELNYEEGLDVFFKSWEPMLKVSPSTLLFNITKEPAISLPLYMNENGMPLGIMLSSSENNDSLLIQFSKFFEDNHMFEMNRKILNHVDKSKLLKSLLLNNYEKNEKFILSENDRKEDFLKVIKKANEELKDNNKENNVNNNINQERVDNLELDLKNYYLKLNGNLIKYKNLIENSNVDLTILDQFYKKSDFNFNFSIDKELNSKIKFIANNNFNIKNNNFYLFTELDRKNRSLGFNHKFNDILNTSIRYINSDIDKFNTNYLDFIISLNKEIKLDENIYINPEIKTLNRIQFKTKLDDTAYINTNNTNFIELTLNSIYKNNDFNFIISPSINYTHSNKKILKENEKGNSLSSINSNINYDLKLSLYKKFKNLEIGASSKIMPKDNKFKFNMFLNMLF